jgi:hypothetical protein
VLTWKQTVKQAGSVPSSGIGRVLVSMPRSVLENLLGGELGSISQEGWECTIKCNQECTSECTWKREIICIWQIGFKCVECSRMYSIKRT